MHIFIVREGEKAKRLTPESVSKRVAVEHRKIVETLLGLTIPIGSKQTAQVHAFMEERARSIEFKIRPIANYSDDPNLMKWAEPIGGLSYEFEDLENSYGLHQSTPEQREQFRNDIRKKLMEPLREELSKAEATVRKLRPFFPVKTAASKPKTDSRPSRPAGLNGSSHPSSLQAAA